MEYSCNNCGCRFEKPITRWERRGEYMRFPVPGIIYCCPSCGDIDYEECNEEEEYEES